MIVVSLTTVKLCAFTPANVTLVVPVKLTPVIVTFVPPAIGPDAGLILVNTGAET